MAATIVAVVVVDGCGGGQPTASEAGEVTEPVAEQQLVEGSADAADAGAIDDISRGGGIGIGTAGGGSGPCGVGPGAPPEPATGEPFPAGFEDDVEDTELIELASRVRSERERRTELVDWNRAETVARAQHGDPGALARPERRERLQSLGLALGAIPAGCEPRVQQGGGYEILAIPPAMDDMSDESAAVVDAAIDHLSEGSELFFICMYWQEEYDLDDDGNPINERRIPVPRAATVLNVWKSPSGEWKIVAWAAMRGVEAGFYPD